MQIKRQWGKHEASTHYFINMDKLTKLQGLGIWATVSAFFIMPLILIFLETNTDPFWYDPMNYLVLSVGLLPFALLCVLGIMGFNPQS